MKNQVISLEDTVREENTKHDVVLEKLHRESRNNPNALGFLLIGSVAKRTHTAKSDLDTITILVAGKPSSGIYKTNVDGIHVDGIYFTYDVLVESIIKVPYLLYPLVNSKILYDPENIIKPLVEQVEKYFKENPEIEKEWVSHYNRSKQIKEQTGCRAQGSNATIIDVWNILEAHITDGKIRRPFFNAFYFTNPRIFGLMKWAIGLLH
jgi:hypothetical protein